MHSVCCGCYREVSNENAKNILNDELVIESSDYIDIAGPISTQTIKLRDGVELLTGYKVSKAENTAVLCLTCCQKIESFMIFRMQLLASFEKLSKHSDSENISKSVPDSDPLQCFEHQKNIVAVIDNYKLLEPNITVDDDVNTNDNKIPSELYNSVKDESETNDSLESYKLPNDQENNNLNDSENSNEVPDVNISKEVVAKVEENDIESKIDIYSGEDDEVVELDVPIKKIDVVDLTGSSESETEVCDYEPIEKKS